MEEPTKEGMGNIDNIIDSVDKMARKRLAAQGIEEINDVLLADEMNFIFMAEIVHRLQQIDRKLT